MDVLRELPGLQLRTEPRAQGWAKALLLIGLGLYFSYTIISGNLTNYINERFAWLSYLAAAMFLLMGGYSLWSLLRPASEWSLNDNRQISWGTLLLVSVPLVLGTLVPSRPLGAESVGRISTTTAPAAAQISDFSIDPLKRNVLDWLRVFNTVSDFAELNGEPANLIGFVYREPGFPADQFMIARFTVSCCVADANAIGVPAYSLGSDALPQGQWVQVEGTFEVGQFRDNVLPVLQVTALQSIEQPEHPYLYP